MQNESDTSRRSTGLVIAGFVVVAVLIVVGLFLPPVSLGERLGLGGSAATPAPVADAAGDAAPTATAALVETSLAAVENPPAAPADGILRSEVYNVTYGSADQPAAIALPAEAGDATLLDMVAWDGAAWTFLPSRYEPTTGELTVVGDARPQTVAVVARDMPAELAVAAAVAPTQELPLELLPLLTEVSAGTLTLNGVALEGEVVEMPSGPYRQLLRATNTGIIDDTASLTALLEDADARAAHEAELVTRAGEGDFAGVNLDYQGATAGQTAAFSELVTSLAAALHEQGLLLAVTVAAPAGTPGSWDTGGQDWAAIGQSADMVFLRLPLDPVAYADNQAVDQILAYAVRLLDRRRLLPVVTADAVDGLGEAFLSMSNEAALANFGRLQFVAGGEEVAPETEVELALSGTATPLEWDGTSLTYRYTYDQSGQTRTVWLGNEAALAFRARFVGRYHLGGVLVDGLGHVTNGPGYATALQSISGAVPAPQPTDAAIVWQVLDADDNVLASDTGTNLTFAWPGTADPGTYRLTVDFALGETLASLGTADVTVAAPEVAEEPEPEEEEAVTAAQAPAAPPSSFTPGDADAVVNTGANVRTGPGLAYGTIAGGLEAGSRISLTGRNASGTWLAIIMPDGETEGWIFAQLVTVNSRITIADLPEKEAPPLAATNPDPGANPAPAPAPVAPIANTGFELGGQAFGAPYGLMSYAGMTWIKRQLKWSPGMTGEAAAGMISEAHNGGFKILLSIPGANLYPSSIDFGAYIDFLRQVASLPDPPNAIEIWNEQNIDREWPAGQINPTDYVNRMLAPAYSAIKGANGNIMVVGGAPAPTGAFGGGCGGGGCDDGPYVAAMAAAGAASYMDCMGVHYNEGILSPNQTSGDPRGNSGHYTRYFWGMVNTYSNAIGGSRPLCFTELGYLSPEGFGALPGGFSWAQNVSVAQQAQWLAEAASLSASSGKVRMMIVWNIDSTTWNSDPQAGYAIIRPGGGCPACESLRQVTGGR